VSVIFSTAAFGFSTVLLSPRADVNLNIPLPQFFWCRSTPPALSSPEQFADFVAHLNFDTLHLWFTIRGAETAAP
jgi:hypothetical protein